MMEHNSIDNVKVKLIPDKSLEISGRVDLFAEDHDFERGICQRWSASACPQFR